MLPLPTAVSGNAKPGRPRSLTFYRDFFRE